MVVGLALGSTGCVAHLVGLVEGGDEALTLVTTEGRRIRLSAQGDAAPVAWLDGHLVEVEGVRVLGRLRITDWKVHEGLHGMTAWAGLLQANGVQLGLDDRNSGAYYLLDPDSTEALWPYRGKPVLVEGYVEGAHRVRVMYFRVLADEE